MTARESGSVSAFVAVVALAAIVVAGLVVDGGRVLSARREADDIAANAARAGAQAVREHDLRTGRRVRIDPVSGSAAVATFLDSTPASGVARIAGDTVIVEVELPVDMLLLGIAGVDRTVVRASRRARAVQGVTAGDP